LGAPFIEGRCPFGGPPFTGGRRILGGGPKFDEVLGRGRDIPFPLGIGRGGPPEDIRGIGDDDDGEIGAGGNPLISFDLDWFTILRLWKIAYKVSMRGSFKSNFSASLIGEPRKVSTSIGRLAT
jgi:hypothetical protein